MEGQTEPRLTVLADHNVEGQTLLLWGTLGAQGWLDLIPLRLLRFSDVNLPHDSNDRIVWRFVQANQMLLLTDNRNMVGQDSLEQTIREENSAAALPVITIGRADQMIEKVYRERCALHLLDIVLDLDAYRGAGRLFIP